MPEYCDSMMKKDELDWHFTDDDDDDDDAVIPSIAIFSYEPAQPEDIGLFALGYKKLQNKRERKSWDRHLKRLGCRRQERRRQLQMSPMDVDKQFRQGTG